MEESSNRSMYTGMLDRTNVWIGNCDSKASTILASIGVIVGLFFASDFFSMFIDMLKKIQTKETIWSCLFLVMMALSVCTVVSGIVCLAFVLIARLGKSKMEKRGVLTQSVFYFKAVSEYKTLEDYQEALEQKSDSELKKDIASQIYACSIICKKKFRLYNTGLILSLIGFASLLVLNVIGFMVK